MMFWVTVALILFPCSLPFWTDQWDDNLDRTKRSVKEEKKENKK